VRLLDLMNSPSGCAKVNWAVTRLRLHAAVENNADGTCRLGLRNDDKRDMSQENIAEAARTNETLMQHGMSLLSLKCERHTAYFGSGTQIYQLCPLDTRFKN